MFKKFIVVEALLLIFSTLTCNAALFDINDKPEGMNSWLEMKDMLSEGRYDEAEQIVSRDDRSKVDKLNYVRLDVNDDKVLWNTTRENLGVGTEAYDALDELMCGDLPNNISDEWKELAEKMYDVPTMRWGGGTSNMHSLWNGVNSYYNKKFSASPFSREQIDKYQPDAENSRYLINSLQNANNMNIVDFIKACEAINPDIGFVFCLSITHATPEENLKFVRFCLDDPDESIYGLMRKNLLHEKPIRIVALEIGNEIYFRSIEHEEKVLNDMREYYAEGFLANAELINSYYPNVLFSPCLMCTEEANNPGVHREWNEYIIKTCGQYMVDHYPSGERLLSLHNYYGGTSLANSYKRIELTYDSCVKIFGENHGFKAYMTEHSKWATNFAPALTLYSGVCSAEFLNRAYQWHDNFIWGAHYYGLYSQNLWAVVRRGYDGKLDTTAVNDVYDMYNRNLGDRVIESSVTTLDDSYIGDIYNPLYRYTACVFANGDDELRIIMTNKTEDCDVDVQLNFATGNKYRLVKEEVLTAKNIYSFRINEKTHDVIYSNTYKRDEENFTHYTIPAYSMVVLTLKSDVKLPKVGEHMDNSKWIGDNYYSDISSNAFSGKINYMTSKGVIQGVSDGMFSPESNVTRAEFAAMICRLIAKDSSAETEKFDDVSSDAWYSKYVSTVVALGYMNGTSDTEFSPDENITMSEAVTALYRCVDAKVGLMPSETDDTLYKTYGFRREVQTWEIPGLKFAVSNGVLDDFPSKIKYDQRYVINRAHAAGLLFAADNIIHKQEVPTK